MYVKSLHCVHKYKELGTDFRFTLKTNSSLNENPALVKPDCRLFPLHTTSSHFLLCCLVITATARGNRFTTNLNFSCNKKLSICDCFPDEDNANILLFDSADWVK